MRHQNGIKKLNVEGSHRRAKLRMLATSLFQHERIETTHLKAKVLRGFAEKLITLAKRGDLHSRRQASAEILDPAVVQKLFNDLAPRFKERKGGYTRVLKLGHRRGDNAMTAYIELVDYKPAAKNAVDADEAAAK